MGTRIFFNETVTEYDQKTAAKKCQIAVVDNNGIPELRVRPEGEDTYNGPIAQFKDRDQFKRFVGAASKLQSWLDEFSRK
jgi:hypothetical protein